MTEGTNDQQAGSASRPFECVVIDLSTQIDFCDPRGANPVANLNEVIPAWRSTVAWAKRNLTPVISSLEAHRPREMNGNGRSSDCCDGSNGQRKIGFTLFRRSINIEVDNTLWCPLDLYARHQQIIFRKRSEDLFENPKADRFLTQLSVKEFLLFGVGLETSIRTLALGLAARRKRVSVIGDACGYWNWGRAEIAKRQMQAKGVGFITVAELRGRKLDRHCCPWIETTEPTDSDSSATGNGRANGSSHGRKNGHPTSGHGHSTS